MIRSKRTQIKCIWLQLDWLGRAKWEWFGGRKMILMNKPPLYWLIASAKASIDSMSKLFVGSSWNKNYKSIHNRYYINNFIIDNLELFFYLPKWQHQGQWDIIQQVQHVLFDHRINLSFLLYARGWRGQKFPIVFGPFHLANQTNASNIPQAILRP